MINKDQENQLSKEYSVKETEVFIFKLNDFAYQKFIHKSKNVIDFPYKDIKAVNIMPGDKERDRHISLLRCAFDFTYIVDHLMTIPLLKARSLQDFRERYIQYCNATNKE